MSLSFSFHRSVCVCVDLFQKRLCDNVGVDRFQILIFLSGANENNGLVRGVGHGDGCADLVIDRVELGQYDSVDHAWAALKTRVIDQRLIEFRHLIDSFVSDQRLANEQHEIGIVHVNQLVRRNRAHERRAIKAFVTFARAIISGSSFCIRPAVSTRTMSNFLSFARRRVE